MLMTGGLPGRRGAFGVSEGEGSSGQTSVRSSDISTNSRERIRLTTFCGRAAAALYGPGE